ncbi:hypothetical protein IMCC26207_1093 [Actinobacteria bacterium IMCC26207]|nr:hypothetical protein IMCC26207_1093 [Actinobacteria bacterium IMCC26207]
MPRSTPEVTVLASLRTLAATGIAVAVAHDRDEAGSQIALVLGLGLVEALESAIGHLGQQPLTGTLRFAQWQPAAAPGVNLVRIQSYYLRCGGFPVIRDAC